MTSAQHAEAVTNFEAGRHMIDKDNNCNDAIPRFQKSIELEPNIGARLSLAECYAKDKTRTADSWNQYKQAEQLAIQKNDPRVDEARKAEQELDPQVMKIILALPSDVPDAVVRIDGVEIPRIDLMLLPTGYALDPAKKYRIEVTAPGRKTWSKADVQGAGGTTLVAMTVVLEGPPPERDGSGQRMIGLIVAGAGVAGVAVGSIFGLITVGKKSDAEAFAKAGPQGNDPTGALESKKDEARSPATVSTIAFIAGGVLLAGGAVLYLTAPKAASTTAAKRIYLTPAIGRTDGGLLLGGSF